MLRAGEERRCEGWRPSAIELASRGVVCAYVDEAGGRWCLGRRAWWAGTSVHRRWAGEGVAVARHALPTRRRRRRDRQYSAAPACGVRCCWSAVATAARPVVCSGGLRLGGRGRAGDAIGGGCQRNLAIARTHDGGCSSALGTPCPVLQHRSRAAAGDMRGSGGVDVPGVDVLAGHARGV